MLLAFHNAFANDRLLVSAIDFILPTLTKNLSSQFCRFVDGGGGIGSSATEYNKILESNLDEGTLENASITCYEPLPENFYEMSKRLASIQRCCLRNVAVASTNGIANFCVPSRLEGNNESWGQGTSYNGFLNAQANWCESIEVEVVRMDSDLATPQDFVKLDLQGGELEAIKGMGHLLQDTKVLYIEAQLMKDDVACQYLVDNGFTIFFDKFQFGLHRDQNRVPIDKLKKLGIRIDKMQLSDDSGMPTILWGYMEKGRDLFDGYAFSQEARDLIKEAGIHYFQTDAICINTKYSHKIFQHFNAVI